MKVNFENIKVLLIGDFMIDQYVFGDSVRISPEAPVPVMIPQKSYSTPGGAGNVALNLKNLGALVTCVGHVGLDREGDELLKLLQRNNINTKHIYSSSAPTTVKKRYYCNGKQVLRVDTEKQLYSWSPPSISDLASENYDVIILSDYDKGVLNSQWFCNIKSDNIIVDPKKNDFSFYSNANIITPNLNELEIASGKKVHNKEVLISVCRKIIEKSNIQYIIAKRSEKGLIVVGENGIVQSFKGHKVKNPDVTGAGDTVIAVFSLVYAKTKNVLESARIANAAASIVVGKKGTGPITINDINSYIKYWKKQ